MSNDPIVISMQNVTICFGEFVALDEIDLDIVCGSTTGIIGPNGAGKTTLFHALTGDLQPDSGTVHVNGVNVTRREPAEVARLGLGKQFQDVRIFRNLSVLENLLLAMQQNGERQWYRAWFGRPSRAQSSRWRKQAIEILERIGLEVDADKPAGSLSYGNQKTLAFGRLLAGCYKILLLDEPLAGLSPQRATKVAKLIRDAVETSNTTVLLIEHNMFHVRKLCERTVVLNRGRVFDEGPTHEILRKASVREICIGL
jgi:branched-chain amino acid transport system ATP-binding protein